MFDFGIPHSQVLLWGWAIPVQARAAPLGPAPGSLQLFGSCSTRMFWAPPCPCVACQFLSQFKANKCFLSTPWILQGLGNGLMCIQDAECILNIFFLAVAAAGSEELWDGLEGLAPCAHIWRTQFITTEVLLEAEWVVLQGCLFMKDRNIVFHPLIDSIFSVKYKYCI